MTPFDRVRYFEVGRLTLTHHPAIDVVVSLTYPALEIVGASEFSGFKIALDTEPWIDGPLAMLPPDIVRLCTLLVDALAFIDMPKGGGG